MSLLGLAMVAISVVLLLTMTDHSLDIILFETVSAFATVGLSTGVTPNLPVAAKYVLIALMFAGRTGSMTVAAALALRELPASSVCPRSSPSSADAACQTGCPTLLDTTAPQFYRLLG